MNLVKNTAQLLEQLFGVHTTERESAVGFTIGVTVKQVVPENPRRVGLIIVNNSLNSLRIGISPDISATRGIYVSPGGGNISIIWDKDFSLVCKEWYGIAGVAASDVYYLEIIMTGSAT